MRNKLILIGAILCIFSLFMTWGTTSRTSSYINMNEQATYYQNGSVDNTYVQPELIQNNNDYSTKGVDIAGFGLLIPILFIILSFTRTNKKFPKYLKYIPFIGYVLLVIIFIVGIIEYGFSFGISLYLISLILLYLGSLKLNIWRPQFVEKFLRRKK